MAINTIDTYVSDKISSILEGFLSSRSTLEDNILSDLPDDIVEPFINTFGYDSNGIAKQEIPVLFTFPSNKEQGTFILVQYEGSQEDGDNSSLGNLQSGIYDYAEGNEIKEKSYVQVDNSGDNPIAFIQMKNDVYSVDNIMEISGSDNLKFKDNKIFVPYMDLYKDYKVPVTVFYTVFRKHRDGGNINHKDVMGYGINLQEVCVVDFVSNNQDTLRCLSNILLAITIYLRQTLEDNSSIYLPNVSTQGNDLIQEINTASNSVTGQQLFYRRLTITYKTTQVLETNAGDRITDVEAEGKLDV
ncbi:orf105 [Lactobacillus phage LP65]|uniref:Orf105 n=1 Tax=Lactobacillus phage LP65 TaxID=2892344 RepID=Q5ULK9_9CAUD|nr:hypothetical protein LP65_gp105 [Lactobacillus phage LP65]AAV35925.1 orf105 [Lactobacillus phage LP65]